MADAPSTLTAWRVGGQLDPAWLTDTAGLAGRSWTHVRVTATLTGATPAVDPTNGAHEHPRTIVTTTLRDTLTGAPSDGQWLTEPLKATKAADADDALQPTGLSWVITVDVATSPGRYVTAGSYTVTVDADRDYVAQGETITVDGEVCVDINALIPVPITTPVSDAFAERVDAVIYVDAPYNGTDDDAPAIQAAIDAAIAAGGGLIRLPPADRPVTLATGLTMPAANIPLVIDAVGSKITYTGDGDMLSITHATSHPSHAKQEIRGGHWYGTTAAVTAFKLTDATAVSIRDAHLLAWPNAVLVHLINDDTWCENTTLENVRGNTFRRFLQMDGNPAGSASFARTRVVNCHASDQGSGDYWIYGNDTAGPYDSLFEIHGNVGANLVAVFRVRAGWGMTRIRSKVEQNVTPTGTPSALIDTDGAGGQPELEDVDWRAGMTLLTAGSTAEDLTPVRFDSGIRVRADGAEAHAIEPGRLQFFGATPRDQRVVTGSTDTAKLASLITALAQYGLIDDQTT